MMIPNYTYITHRVVVRPWGIECLFTVADPEGNEINDIVVLESEIEDIAAAIFARLAEVTVLVPETESAKEQQQQVVSSVDIELIAVKDKLKIFGLTYIKMNPGCTLIDYFAAFDAEFDSVDALMARKLLSIYAGNAVSAGFIPDDSFPPFRDFIYSTPVDVLMGL